MISFVRTNATIITAFMSVITLFSGCSKSGSSTSNQTDTPYNPIDTGHHDTTRHALKNVIAYSTGISLANSTFSYTGGTPKGAIFGPGAGVTLTLHPIGGMTMTHGLVDGDTVTFFQRIPFGQNPVDGDRSKFAYTDAIDNSTHDTLRMVHSARPLVTSDGYGYGGSIRPDSASAVQPRTVAMLRNTY